MSFLDKLKNGLERTVNFVTGGRNDRKRTEQTIRWAKEDQEEAKIRLEECRLASSQAMDNLGEVRARVYNTTVSEFVRLYDQISSITPSVSGQLSEHATIRQINIDIRELKIVSKHVQEILIGGGAGIAGGATAALGAWGLVGAFGTASTGTAISTLSGAAATNATLAWFGGGAVSASGLGVTAGTAALSGIVLIPAAVLAMYFGQSNAKKHLDAAQEFRYGIEAFVGEVDTFIEHISQITNAAKLMTDVVDALDKVVLVQNKKMEEAIISTSACMERLQRALDIELVKDEGMISLQATAQLTMLNQPVFVGAA